ncbi:MAG: septum formation protein Maf [Candidatus Zixiibacteriota bacterium]|nr:MAG: septum formation protein Maf [candidate division Zixibacteria bacterium]
MKYKYLTRLADKYEIVLGSRSPRRLKLLKETGIHFKQIIPNLEEDQLPGEPPYEFAERLARDKALEISQQLTDRQLVIGCDTIVVLQNRVLGKPADQDEAFNILSSLAGKSHIVCTALALADRSGILTSGYELTSVIFNSVTPRQIKDYIASGEPMDKAGSYGIQGMGAFLVDSIEGNLDTVIGFPRELLECLAKRVLERQ